MSAKHRNILSRGRLDGRAVDIDMNIDIEGMEGEAEGEIQTQTHNFTVLDESSSDTETDPSSDRDSGSDGVSVLANVTACDESPPHDPQKTDDSYEEEDVEGNTQLDEWKTPVNSSNDSFLYVAQDSLDVDAVMRMRFGGRALSSLEEKSTGRCKPKRRRGRGELVQVNNMNHGRGRRAYPKRRHLVFGTPKEDWPRPLSLVCGGIGVEETSPPVYYPVNGEKWIKFKWSEDYRRAHESFAVVQSSGDVNMLAAFIGRYPHHLDALVQLGMVFARTGQMDRAGDLIRRCLYYCECAGLDGFRPFRLVGCAGNRYLMDAKAVENNAFFTALFRHMQIVAMLGCPSVAADVGKCLLSLSPATDPMGALLFIDHLLLQARREDEIASFCSEAAAAELGLPDGVHLHEVLPFWAFSCSLATKLNENKGVRFTESHDTLVDALRRFPFMLRYLLETSTMESDRWKRIFSSTFFSRFSSQSQLEHTVGKSGAELLCHIGNLYRIRSSTLLTGRDTVLDGQSVSIWQRSDVLDWLYDAADSFLKGLQEGECTTEQAVSLATHDLRRLVQVDIVTRCIHAQSDDFLEEFPRLPPDADPLDPRLANPRVLAGLADRRELAALLGDWRGVRLGLVGDNQRRGVARLEEVAAPGGAIAHALSGGEVNELALRAELTQMRRQGVIGDDVDDTLDRILAISGSSSSRGNLDPNLPLMQLFLATFFPWNRLDMSYMRK